MATPALSQHIGGGALPAPGGTASPGRRFKFTLPNAIGSGNMILLGLSWTSGIGNPTITDSLGNTWPTSPNVSADAGAGNMISTIWVLPNSASGVNTITVKFPAVTNEFHHCESEFYNVATSGSGTWNGTATTGATPVASPACGSFTPTNNNANGGNLIWTYFCSSNLIASGNPTLWTPTATGGITPTLLDADIGWTGTSFGMPHASQYLVQPTAGAINSAATLTGDAVDTFNCLSIAIPAAAAGTAPAAGIRIVRICHFGTLNFPTGVGTYTLQLPSTGNARLLTCTDPNTTVTGISDSQSNTWVHLSTITGDNFWYFVGGAANTNSLTATISTSAGANKLSWRYVDIAGVNTVTPIDVQVNVGSTALNGATVWDNAPTISPTSPTGGVMIANLGLGQGPGYGFDTGAPAGAVFDLCTYLNCRFTGQFTTTTNLSVTAIADGDLAVNDVINNPATQGFATITVSAGGGTGNYTTTTASTTASEAMWAGETDNDYADNADLMAHAYYGAGGGTFHWNWVMVNMATNSGSGGAVAFAAAPVAAAAAGGTMPLMGVG